MTRHFPIAGVIAGLVLSASPAAAQFESTYMPTPLTGERLSPAEVADILANDRSDALRALADKFRALSLAYDGREDLGWSSDYDYRLVNSLTWGVHRNLDMSAMLHDRLRNQIADLDAKREALAALPPTSAGERPTDERLQLEKDIARLETRVAVTSEDLVVQNDIRDMLAEEILKRKTSRAQRGMPAFLRTYFSEIETLLAETP